MSGHRDELGRAASSRSSSRATSRSWSSPSSATASSAALEAKGGFVDLDQSLKLGRPELRVIPDREKAAALGVDADQLATTVQAMIGGMDVGTFNEAGNRYDIRVRLEEKDRRDPDSILAPLRAHAAGRHDGAPQPGAHREGRGALHDHAREPPARRAHLGEPPDGKDLGEAIQEAQRAREGDAARGRDHAAGRRHRGVREELPAARSSRWASASS